MGIIGTFGKDLEDIARRIQKTFQILDSVAASTVDKNFTIKVLERLNHPGKPAKIKVQTHFEKIFKREMLCKVKPKF